jgi:hypothetical protein
MSAPSQSSAGRPGKQRRAEQLFRVEELLTEDERIAPNPEGRVPDGRHMTLVE